MDDLVKQLMHATVSIDGDFDVGCNVRDAAVERLERYEWQPIDTAPKDGTRVIAFFPLFKTAKVAWHKTFYLDGPLWACDAVRSPDRWSDQPSHWMPLPAAPTNV